MDPWAAPRTAVPQRTHLPVTTPYCLCSITHVIQYAAYKHTHAQARIYKIQNTASGKYSDFNSTSPLSFKTLQQQLKRRSWEMALWQRLHTTQEWPTHNPPGPKSGSQDKTLYCSTLQIAGNTVPLQTEASLITEFWNSRGIWSNSTKQYQRCLMFNHTSKQSQEWHVHFWAFLQLVQRVVYCPEHPSDTTGTDIPGLLSLETLYAE